MEPSTEQLAVVKALCDGENVVVDAVAGSGKTTTIVFVAQTLVQKRILILTYNRKLKEETRQRLQEYEDVDVHNYHSLVQSYFGVPCQDDKMMADFLGTPASKMATYKDLPNFDLIILDEVQDMTPLYFQLVHFLKTQLKDPNPQLCCLGDRMQCIYQFMRADHRFITHCAKVFAYFNDRPWHQKPLTLRTSYRMSQPTTRFLNNVFLKENRLDGHSVEGCRPVYIHANIFNVTHETAWVKYIVQAINEHGPGNTFILAPSLRAARSPVRILEHYLVATLNIPCYVPTADERELSRPAMNGKVVFSTFHQSKGMERDLVLVFGIEDTMIHRYISPTVCDNKLYVALTRSRKQLILLQDASKPHLQFINPRTLHDSASVISSKHPSEWLTTHPYILAQQQTILSTTFYPKSVVVTNLLRHCHFEDLANLESLMCTQECLHPANEEKLTNPLLSIENYVTTSLAPLQTEEVSDLTGTAMQAWLEYKIQGTLKSIGKPDRYTEQLPAHKLLIMTNDFDANGATSYHSRRKQIQEHHHRWVTTQHFDIAWSNFARKIDRENIFRFEERVSHNIGQLHNAPDHMSTQVIGVIDILEIGADEKVTIWEIKFVSQIQTHHVLQAATYGILYWLSTGVVPTVYLYNLRTDEQIQVYLPESQEHAINCLRIMLYFKSAHDTLSVDDEFFKQTRAIVTDLSLIQ